LNANEPCTQPQRMAIRGFLSQLELPLDRVTVLHRDLFSRCGIAWHQGANVDTTLEGLTKAQASALITRLKERAR
jgi:hypothetical protein